MARRTSAWCMGLYVETPHGKSSRPVAWLCMTKFDRELWETQSGWRLLDKKWCLAVGFDMHDVDILRLILSKGLARNGRENARNGRKKARNGREKKTCTTWPSCFDRHDVSRVFENPFYAWSEEKAPPCGLELVGGMLLLAGGILAYEKHTWCWGGYFRFTLSKARLFTCAAMQPMLSGVAVRGRIWHAAHALARDKSVLSSLWGKNQVDYYGEPRNFGHLFFFQTLKRAHFLKSGRKNGTHFCVPMGGSGIYNHIWYHRI